jgi:uncharacterized glyoxalase superfamily protein PhnB
MARRAISDQLDAALDAMLARPGAATPAAEPEIAALLPLATELCDLPSPAFRARLKSALERRVSMTATATATQPVQGMQSVTPYLVAPDAPELVDFVKQAFDAQELGRAMGSAGGMHCDLRIGGVNLMIGGGFAYQGPSKLASLHLYVPDADAQYQRALAAGATSLYPPDNKPYGDREAGILDRSGNRWFIGTHKAGPTHIPEGLGPLTAGLQVIGAAAMIEFLQRAFHAETVQRFEATPGTVVHAKLRLGNSIIELGEAHGPWQPLPAMFYFRVADADTVYQQALAAGATSIHEPRQQPYGERVGGVKDPFGNEWYLATPVSKG